MKRKSNQHTMKEAIDRLLKTYNLGDKMTELDLVDSWEQIMGKAIARRTSGIWFKQRVLHVKLDSSVLREELTMGKTALIRLLNEKMGTEVVDDIIFQ